jgi:Protein of unknown function (DUF2934)
MAALHNSNPTIRKKEISVSAKQKGNGSTGPHATPAQAAETREASVVNGACDEDIRRRAYEIYLERGQEPSRDLDDWLQAERELDAG